MSENSPEATQAQQGSGEQIGGPNTVLQRDAATDEPNPAAVPAPGQVDAGDVAQSGFSQPQQAQPEPPRAQAGLMSGAANQSPQLPPNAQAGAAKAHAILGHLIQVAEAARGEIERYVPPELLNAAGSEAMAFVRQVIG